MRILVVEDETGLANSIVAGLKEERYAVDHAADGESAEFLAETNEYDLIVLDVMLPKLDGFQVCRDLRSRNVTTPILMLTALDGTADKVKGLDSGAEDYLTKPFSFEEFLARVRALLRRGPLVASTTLEYADIKVDLIAHKVMRDGRRIELTVKEYGLLEYFLRNPGRVVSRSQLAEHVWDQYFDPMSNVIDVSISHLRKKLEAEGGARVLHSVRGMGYILKDG
ncbi:MAG TPA: response regulator transcription factor [Blastocatellia bacterium]|nr:response regulator transcription factor [Blastocatellia bacterium]